MMLKELAIDNNHNLKNIKELNQQEEFFDILKYCEDKRNIHITITINEQRLSSFELVS